MAKTKTSPLQRGMSMVLAVLMLMSMFVFNAGAAGNHNVNLADGDVTVTVETDGSAKITQDTNSMDVAAGDTITFTGTGDDDENIDVTSASSGTTTATLNIVMDGADVGGFMNIDSDVPVALTVKGESNAWINGDLATLTMENGYVNIEGDIANAVISGGEIEVVSGSAIASAVITGGAISGTVSSAEDKDGNPLVKSNVSVSVDDYDAIVVTPVEDTSADPMTYGTPYEYGSAGVTRIKDDMITIYVADATNDVVTFAVKETVTVEEDYKVDYEAEEVTFLVDGDVYYLKGDPDPITIVTTGTANNNVVNIKTDLDSGYSFVKKGQFESLNSDAVVLERATAPDVEAINVTADAKNKDDGKLVITAVEGATYQYRLATDTDWTAVVTTDGEGKNATANDDDTITVTGLKAGDYEVRVAAVKEKSFASAIAEVTIGTDQATVKTPVIDDLDSKEIAVNSTITLKVKNAATEYPSNPTYQWYRNGNAIVDAKGSELVANLAGSYTVTVTELGATSKESAAVVLTKATFTFATPVITADKTEADFTATPAETATLTVNSDKFESTATYEWFKDGVTQGAASSTATSLPVSEVGSYTVKVVDGDYAATSAAVTISQTGISRPEVISYVTGDTEKVSVVEMPTTGTITLAVSDPSDAVDYAWFLEGNSTAVGTSDTLVIDGTTLTAGTYYVVATDKTTTTLTSTSATVTVYADATEVPVIKASPSTLPLSGNTGVDLTVENADKYTNNPTYTWYWNDVELVGTGMNGSSIKVYEEGNYTVSVNNGNAVKTSEVLKLEATEFTVSVTADKRTSRNTTLTATTSLTEAQLAEATVVWSSVKGGELKSVNGAATDALKWDATSYDTYTVTITYDGLAVSDSVKTNSGGTTGGSSSSGSTTQYTLTFETNGGTSIASKSFDKDTVVKLSEYTTTKTGYSFAGWYSDKDLTTAVSSVTMTSNTTVYAKWEKATSLLDTENHNAYIEGYSDGTFKPSNNVTRAQTATMLYRLLTSSAKAANSTTSNSFSDVSTANWYNTEVSTMSKLGVINGYTNGTFGGDKSITRAEFAVMVARLSSNTYTGDDKFDDISGHWAAKEINLAAANGWITGYSDGSYAPNKNITRAEAVTILNRVVGRDSIGEMADAADMTTFSDVSSSSWYYEAVQEAANTHTYEVKDGKEVWTTSKSATADAE